MSNKKEEEMREELLLQLQEVDTTEKPVETAVDLILTADEMEKLSNAELEEGLRLVKDIKMSIQLKKELNKVFN